VTIAAPIDTPPNWSQGATELACPLCEYNLRGLTEPRCPECGFAFTWAELIQGKREAHRYLFEHHPNRNIWSFCKTYWHDSFPARFWRDISPSNVVRPRRLMLYWVVSVLPLFIALFSPFAWNLFDALAAQPAVAPFMVLPSPNAFAPRRSYMATPVYVAPPPLTFVDHVQRAWDITMRDVARPALDVGFIVVLIWPWLTLLALLIFSQSMRRAKVKKVHVLRAIVYGCDFYLIMFFVVFLGKFERFSDLWMMQLPLACAALSLYRLYFAYRSYLRFHLPFATVSTAQFLVFLVALIVYFQAQVLR
jgi:hypothetical protein